MKVYDELNAKGILKEGKQSGLFIQGKALEIFKKDDWKKQRYVKHDPKIEISSLPFIVLDFIVHNLLGKRVKCKTVKRLIKNKIEVITTLELIKKTKKNKKRR